MPLPLDSLMSNWAKTVYPFPQNLPRDKQLELKHAFIAGAWAALSELPMGNLGHGQQIADSLRNQCQMFLSNMARTLPAPAAVQDPAPPAAGSDADTTEFPAVTDASAAGPPETNAAAPTAETKAPPAADAGNDDKAQADPPAAD